MNVWERKEMPPVKAVMTAFPHSVGADEPLAAARRMMVEHDIRHLPVVEDGRLVGVISDRDARLPRDPDSRPPDDEGLTVRDACLFEAYVVGLNEPLVNVLSEMAARHIGSALVVKNRRLAGIFTVTDACRTFADCLRAYCPVPGGDEAA